MRNKSAVGCLIKWYISCITKNSLSKKCVCLNGSPFHIDFLTSNFLPTYKECVGGGGRGERERVYKCKRTLLQFKHLYWTGT